MATLRQKDNAISGLTSLPVASQSQSITMAAGATTDVTWPNIPTGAQVRAIKWATGTAFTGSPTNIYLTAGTSSGDNTYVANTDVKAKTSWTAASLAATNASDLISWPAGTTLHTTLTANGGTNPAGTCVIAIEYTPPA